MSKLRKRAIYKSMKYHATMLMSEWHSNEHAQACFGISVIPIEREIEICNTLSNYARIVERVSNDDCKKYESWINHLYDFY